MKVTVVKNKGERNETSLITSIILLVLGLILTFNASGFLNIVFTVLGAFVLLYGIYKVIQYYQLKQQFKTEDSNLLLNGIVSVTFGFLIILLANIITSAIQVLTGIWLLFLGISRLASVNFLDVKSQLSLLLSSIVLLLLGLYTIFSENVVFMAIGIILTLYAIFDIIKYIQRKKSI